MTAGPACPLCRGAAPKTFVRAWREYRLYDCPDCGAGFCDPFKNPGSEYYEENKDVYATNLAETTDDTTYEYDEALKRLSALPPGARLLDVGCGSGGFLHRARAASLAVSGLDFNKERVAALRGRGFDVFAGGLPEFARDAAPASFDAVTLFQVLEHLDDPAGWLDAAKSLLKPGGLLIVGVPNRERTFDPYQGPGLEEIDNPPHHLTRWSAAALTALIRARGFDVRECFAPPYPPALVRLLARETVRFGLAVRALDVDQVRPVAAAAKPGARELLIRALVAAKSAVLDGAATLGYPFFRAAAALFGWRGAALVAVARKPL